MTTHPIALNLQFGVAHTGQAQDHPLFETLLAVVEAAPRGMADVIPVGKDGLVLQISLPDHSGSEVYSFSPGFEPGTVRGEIRVVRPNYRIETQVDARPAAEVMADVASWAGQTNATLGQLGHLKWDPLRLPELLQGHLSVAADPAGPAAPARR